jgi:hypothetical protein
MRTAIWAVPLLLGLGCDQKEPPSLDADAGTRSYYPFVDGARYRYLHSKGGWVETVTIAAVRGERDTFEQTQSPNTMGESGTSMLVRRSGEVLRVSEEQFLDDVLTFSIEYDPGFLRFADSWAEERVGFSETRSYERTETKAGGAPKAPQPREHVFSVEEVGETVTVPAGTFRNCVVIRRERVVMAGGGGGAGGPLGGAGAFADEDAGVDGQAGSGATGGSGGSSASGGSSGSAGSSAAAQDDQRKLFWFAPGVGKVREENLDTRSTEELIDYQMPEG